MRGSLHVRCGLVVVLLLGVAGIAMSGRWSPPPEPAAPLWVDAGLLKPGDLIFRRGNGLTSRIVLAADRRAAYSHVGIVYLGAGGPHVIHAVPGATLEQPSPLRVEPLAQFTGGRSVLALSIRRLTAAQGTAVAEHAAQRALAFAQAALLFDADFSLQSLDKLYCTELVWRAYQEAGLDLVDGVFDELHLPFSEGPYLLPSSLLASPYLTEVLSLTRKPADHHD